VCRVCGMCRVCGVCGGRGGVGVVGVWGHSLRSTFHRLHLLRIWTPTILLLLEWSWPKHKLKHWQKWFFRVNQIINVADTLKTFLYCILHTTVSTIIITFWCIVNIFTCVVMNQCHNTFCWEQKCKVSFDKNKTGAGSVLSSTNAMWTVIDSASSGLSSTMFSNRTV
jgi:hypothetical protein